MAPPAAALAGVDVAVLCLYLASVVALGVGVSWRKARRRGASTPASVSDYFLAGRRLPWWALGIADMSSWVDISGTMIICCLLYAFGLSGAWIELRGGFTLMLAFQVVLTGKLTRRTRAVTNADFLELRFGTGRQGRLARAVGALVGFLTQIITVSYFAIGGGKFVEEFVEVPSWLGIPSHLWAAAGLMLVAMSYTVISGLAGIVWTDVWQAFFMLSIMAVVAVKAVAETELGAAVTVFLPALGDSSIRAEVPAGTWASLVAP